MKDIVIESSHAKFNELFGSYEDKLFRASAPTKFVQITLGNDLAPDRSSEPWFTPPSSQGTFSASYHTRLMEDALIRTTESFAYLAGIQESFQEPQTYDEAMKSSQSCK